MMTDVVLEAKAGLTMASPAEATAWFSEVRRGLTSRVLAPYLGPAISASSAVPMSYDQLADFLGKKVALPKRARGNPWASAQFIESQKLRGTVVKFVAEAFEPKVEPNPLQRWLATLGLPLIVDTWYDGALRAAFSNLANWAEIQGISRAAIGESRWYRAYDGEGRELPLERVGSYATLLYKPHGSVVPARNFLISDADYVEVLTEIDIQSPIPELVKERRKELGFVFLGCRFHDQLLRNYARQITKRSAGPHYALIDSRSGLTRNEHRVLSELGVRTLVYPLADGMQELTRRE